MNRKLPLVATIMATMYFGCLPIVVTMRGIAHADDEFGVVMRSDAACARRPGAGCATTPIERFARFFAG